MSILSAQVVVPCTQFDATFAALTEQLGFRVDMISPADAPTLAVVSGFGVTLRLVSASNVVPAAPIALRLATDHPMPQVAMADIAIEWENTETKLQIPDGAQEFVLTRLDGPGDWQPGRAGMLYRDLIPGRLGGRIIASHIRIAEAGPVPDYVHFHDVRFQMIFCKAGWVRVVYEDQGEPFVLHAGDCVLQPPQIRHRVLDASAGLEVIEIGCPAVHETRADHALSLPTSRLLPTREFSGQRFVRHEAANAHWAAWQWLGAKAARFEARDTGIALATSALASVCVVRADVGAIASAASHSGEFLFLFVLSGALQIFSAASGTHTLEAGDCVTIPARDDVSLRAAAPVEFLEVGLPAA